MANLAMELPIAYEDRNWLLASKPGAAKLFEIGIMCLLDSGKILWPALEVLFLSFDIYFCSLLTLKILPFRSKTVKKIWETEQVSKCQSLKTCNFHQVKGKILWFYSLKSDRMIASKIWIRPALNANGCIFKEISTEIRMAKIWAAMTDAI